MFEGVGEIKYAIFANFKQFLKYTFTPYCLSLLYIIYNYLNNNFDAFTVFWTIMAMIYQQKTLMIMNVYIANEDK